MKTILFLGAAMFQIPPIVYAKQEGYRVITTDNQPQNPGHALADRSYHISTIDKEAILELAQKEQIDGILSFGSDVSVRTAAYVAEKLGLPSNSYQTVLVLTHKGRFRDLLQREGLQAQQFQQFNQESEQETIHSFIKDIAGKVVIKPVDVSGSKGVSIIQAEADWQAEVAEALERSFSKEIIIESYVEKAGKQICGDGYMEAGKLKFICYGDGYFYDDGIHLAPYAESFPSTQADEVLTRVGEKLERILQKANFHSGTFNFDVMLTTEGKIFVIEIGPRSGGNYLPVAIQLYTNVDLVAAAVETCIDTNYELEVAVKPSTFFYACYMLHARETGVLKEIKIDPQLLPHIFMYHPYTKIGEPVEPFVQANRAVGNMILRFQKKEEMLTIMSDIRELCQIVVKTENNS